jgi:hypothetical protein
VEWDETAYAFDSTTIDLCRSLFPWARRSLANVRSQAELGDERKAELGNEGHEVASGE